MKQQQFKRRKQHFIDFITVFTLRKYITLNFIQGIYSNLHDPWPAIETKRIDIICIDDFSKSIDNVMYQRDFCPLWYSMSYCK